MYMDFFSADCDVSGNNFYKNEFVPCIKNIFYKRFEVTK